MAARRGRQAGPSFKDLVREDLKSGKYRPVYVLSGGDDYRIEQVVHHMRDDILGPEGAAFNFHTFYGDLTPLAEVLQAARGFPMFGDRVLVWLKGAAAVLGNKDGEAALGGYLADTPQTTVLVLSDTKFDGRRKWVKECRKAGYVFDFSPPEGDELAQWVAKAASKAGVGLERADCELLIDLVGNNLQALNAEIEKLSVLAGDRDRPLTSDEVRLAVMDQRQMDDWALVNAASEGNATDTLRCWRRQLRWGASVYEVAPGLIWKVRQLADMASLVERGYSDDDVARELKMNPWMVRRTVPTARRLGARGIQRLLKEAAQCESAIKRSTMPADIAVERLLLAFCGVSGDEVVNW